MTEEQELGARWWDLEVQETPLQKGLQSQNLEEEQELMGEQPAKLEGSLQAA